MGHLGFSATSDKRNQKCGINKGISVELSIHVIPDHRFCFGGGKAIVLEGYCNGHCDLLKR